VSLVIAAVTKDKAYLVCDGRAMYRGRATRSDVKKFVDVVPGRLVLAYTGDGAAVGFLQHIAKRALERCEGGTDAVFQGVKEQITANAHGLTHPVKEAVARLPWPLSLLFRKPVSRLKYEIGIVLVGWDGRSGRMRLCAWGNQDQAGNLVSEEYRLPAVVCIGRPVDPQEFAWLRSTLASGGLSLAVLEETIRSASARDNQIGGEIFTCEINAEKFRASPLTEFPASS